jgi:hypothetical protein
MLTLTVSELIDDDHDHIKLIDHRIYRAREAETIFYVGMSRADITDRVISHLGLGPFGVAHGPSELGRFIVSQAPDSGQWLFDFLTLPDCEAITGNLYQVGNLIGEAEADLIQMYRPYFNRVYNGSGGELPAKYRSAGMFAQRAKERRPPGVYSFDLTQLSKVQCENGHERSKRSGKQK